ncbi:MAG: NnrS family protein, partial [Gammaproteobacteria bacterium]|nr:NnrS family protein [Gammaproteobacteria bacterium]
DIAAFLLLNLAALLRVAAGAFAGRAYAEVVSFAGILWIGAFSLFLLRYLPMLMRPRIDGAAG